ncbi:TonB-dependent receptor, partial [bacterium]|nr:TonB-dependent receptor [bacterium]
MRGPFSALYGNSSGGVVQSITRKGDKDPTLSLGFSIDRFNTARSSATYEGQLEKLNYIMSVSDISSDGWRDHSAYKKDNFNGKFIYEQSKDTKLTLILNYFNQPYTLDPQSLSPAQFGIDPKKSPENATITGSAATTASDKSASQKANSRVFKEQSLAGIILDHNISNSQSLRLMGYYGIRENLQYLTTSASGFRRNLGGADLKWMYKETIFDRPYSITAGLSYDKMNDQRQRFDTTATLSAVGDAATTDYTGNKTRYNRDETQNGFSYDQYAQFTFEPTSQWLLIGGIRQSRVKLKSSDKFYNDCAVTPTNNGSFPSGCFDTQAWDSGSLTFNNTAPVFGATFKATSNLNIYANYGEGFETPTFSEMTYSNPTTGAGPNLNLRPSESKNYELGFKAFVTNNTKVNMALFKVDSKNEMVVDRYDSDTKQTSYKSIAKTERKGVELSIDSRLPYNFNFYGAYTLMDAEFTEAYASTGTTAATSGTVTPGKRIPATYKTTTYSELSWKYPTYGFSSALEVIYFSDSYAYDLNLNTYRAQP